MKEHPARERVEVATRGEQEVLAAARAIRAKRSARKVAAKRRLARRIRAEGARLPDGPFRVISVDPPWRYDTGIETSGLRGLAGYPDMSVEEICELPIARAGHRDCVLWLWTTNAFMRAAFTVLDAWGFQEKTILTWDKEKLGVGHWLRNVTEHCILAVRGRPVVELGSQPTIIREPRREHSRKPEAFYRLVEGLCPGNKLEVFARESRPGWTAWGAELGKFDA
jgi:N6-adenosine-specific RNA methylase IME4